MLKRSNNRSFEVLNDEFKSNGHSRYIFVRARAQGIAHLLLLRSTLRRAGLPFRGQINLRSWTEVLNFYIEYQGFGQAELGYSGLVLDSSQFLKMPSCLRK